MHFRIALSFCLIAGALFGKEPLSPNIKSDIEAIISSSKEIVEEAKKSKMHLSELENYQALNQTKPEICESSSCNIPLEHSSGLVVLTSESVSKVSWQEHSAILEKAGGRFILRGLPNNSFLNLASFLRECKEENILAPVDLEPELFKKYHVQSVPTIVLDNGESFDKIVGNISIQQALETFAKSGSTSVLAKQLLYTLKQQQASGVFYEN